MPVYPCFRCLGSIIIHAISHSLPVLFLSYCSSHQLKGRCTCVFPHSLFTISFWFLYLLAKNVHLWFPLGFRFPSLFVSVAIGRLPMHQWMPHTHPHVDNIYWTRPVVFIFKAKKREGCGVGKETC